MKIVSYRYYYPTVKLQSSSLIYTCGTATENAHKYKQSQSQNVS